MPGNLNILRTVVVTSEVEGLSVPATSLGTFITWLCRLLRASGDQVTLVYAGKQMLTMDSTWSATYQHWGIDFVQVSEPASPNRYWPAMPSLRLSEAIADYVSNADIAYFQDFGAHAFHTLRTRRYKTGRRPVCVTLLHGPSIWRREALYRYPSVPDDLNLDFAEAYAAQHSDFV